MRIALALALALAAAAAVLAPAAGGYPFAGATQLTAGRNPHGVTTADLNGDGRRDIVVANAGDNAAGVYLGLAGGGFGTMRAFATGTKPKYVAAADLNRDGRPDLVSANQDSSNVSVLLGAGDGTFGAAVNYGACLRPHDVGVGDLNRDGNPDVVIPCWDATSVSVLLGRGDGTLAPATTLTTGFGPNSVVVLDLDADAKPDIAVTNHGADAVAVFRGNGDGTFAAPAAYATARGPHSVRAGDLNGDGKPDLVTANDLSDSVSVLLGNGDGTFRPAISAAVGKVPKSAAVGDVDGDGLADVVASNTAGNGDGVTGIPGGDNVSVLRGHGDGTFEPAETVFVGATPFSVALADLNADGLLDVATANWDGGTVGLLMNRRSDLQPGFSESTVLSGLTSPTVVRFSPDGRIFVGEKSGLIKVFDGLGDPTPTIFADLSTEVHNYWDRGLLGLALDPNFPASPYVYALYTRDAAIGGSAPRWGLPGVLSDPCPSPPGPTADGCVVSGRLVRMRAAGNVIEGTPQTLLDGWCQQYPSHSVGSLVFGADGALYVSGGEGASFSFSDYGQRGNPCGDPPGAAGTNLTLPSSEGGSLRSQDLRTSGDPAGLSGTVLRLDPATGDAMPDNPNALSPDPNERRIIAYGLRNPFRMAVKPGTNELWIGDVGNAGADEIDKLAPAGPVENYGWPCYEGSGRSVDFDPLDLTLCETLYTQPGAVTGPEIQYTRNTPLFTGDACPTGQVTTAGITFYGTGSYPGRYAGAMFFADYSRKCIWARLAGSTAIENFAQGLSSPVDLQVGPGGDLYYVDLDGGTIRRIRYGSGGPPADPCAGATCYVSDLPWTSMANGWGPVERDRSNGEQGAADGRTLTLNGVTYAKGLGAHAASDARFDLSSRACTRFRSDVGVDDEIPASGSVTFQVWLDGVKAYESAVMSAASATASVDVDVTGKRELRLVVTDGGSGGIDFDHGDWANARLACADATPPVVSSTSPDDAAAGVATSATVRATFSEPMDAATVGGSTFTLARLSDGSPVAATVAYDAGTRTATLTPSSALPAGTQLRATVKGGSSGVKDAAGNPLAADRAWTFTTAPTTTGSPPVPSISAPAASTTWAVGDTVAFSGSATDPDEGPLPPSALSWRLVMQHCPSTCHSHVIQTFAGVATGSFVAPDHEYPSHLDLELTATDASGASATTTVRLDPRVVTLTLQSAPAGLTLAAGSGQAAAPFTKAVIVGSTVTLSAPSPQTQGSASYAFASWSDGGARSHDVVAPAAPQTLTATFTAASTRYVSDLPWTLATNGWGPPERDMSNGEQLAGDGLPLTLGGVVYPKGVGAHANSDVRVALSGLGCTRFQAVVGVDAEVSTRGSVVFQAWRDGTLAYDSGVLRGGGATPAVDVDVTGAAELRLVVTTAGDGDVSDHGDWADAKLVCTPDATPPSVTSTVPADGATGVAATASVKAVFSEPLDPATVVATTFTLARVDTGAAVSASVALDAAGTTATLAPAAALAGGVQYRATVKGGVAGVADRAGNRLAADRVWTFTTQAPAPDFAIAASPSSRSVTRGGSTTYTVSVTPLNGYAGRVGLSLVSRPSGVTESFSTATLDFSASSAPASSVMTVRTSATMKQGTYTLTVRGADTAGGPVRTVAVTLAVRR